MDVIYYIFDDRYTVVDADGYELSQHDSEQDAWDWIDMHSDLSPPRQAHAQTDTQGDA